MWMTITIVLLMVLSTASAQCEGDLTTWRNTPGQANSWLNAANWDCGVPDANRIARIINESLVTVAVIGSGVCKGIQVGDPSLLFGTSASFVIQGSLVVGSSGITYRGRNNTFLGFTLAEPGSSFTVNGELSWTLVPPMTGESSIAVLTNSTGGQCQINSLGLGGGSLLNGAGVICRITERITTNYPSLVRVSTNYAPDSGSAAVFTFDGPATPYLTGITTALGPWSIGAGGVQVDQLVVSQAGSLVGPGPLRVMQSLNFSNAQTVAPTVVTTTGSQIVLVANSALAGGFQVGTGGMSLRGPAGTNLLIGRQGPLLLAGSITGFGPTWELQGPRTVRLPASFSCPPLRTSGGRVDVLGGSTTLQAPGLLLVQQGSSLYTSEGALLTGADADVLGKLSVEAGRASFTGMLSVHPYAALAVGSAGNVTASMVVFSLTRALLQMRVSGTPGVLTATTAVVPNGAELSLVVDPSFNWGNGQTVTLVRASIPQTGAFGQLTGTPNDGAIYTIVYSPNAASWTSVGVRRDFSGDLPVNLDCSSTVCGVNANCRNCPTCSSDVNGNRFCCAGSATTVPPFCFFPTQAGQPTCEEWGCPIIPTEPPATASPTPAPSGTNAPTRAPSATNAPTAAPSGTNAPTRAPSATNAPTAAPSGTNAPTRAPSATNAPTAAPSATNAPTAAPSGTNAPTRAPTAAPSGTNAPTAAPSATNAPTAAPSGTNAPTRAPSATNAPTAAPSGTNAPTTASPTNSPTTAAPTGPPTTAAPTAPTTAAPTESPTTCPTCNDPSCLSSTYLYSMDLFGGNGAFYWGLPPGCNTRKRDSGEWFDMAFVNKQTLGWFGFGLPPDVFLPGEGHRDTDIMLFSVNPADPTALISTDMWSFNTSAVLPDTELPDGQDNIILEVGFVRNGVAFAKFRRLVDTNSSFDRAIELNRTQGCLFAFFNESNDFGPHDPSNAQLDVCNFGNVTVVPPEVNPFPHALIVAHGVIGALGVGLFLTLGAFLARYAGSSSLVSMLVNVAFYLGTGLVVISFIIAGVMVSQGSGVHYNFSSPSGGAHSFISLVTFISAVAFVVVRLVTELCLNPGEDGISKLGRAGWYAILAICILTGWATLFLGFVDLQETWPWLWVIGAILIAVGVAFIVAEILYIIWKSKNSDSDDEGIEMAEAARKRNNQ